MTFDYNNAALAWLGQYGDFPLVSQNARDIKGLNSELRFKATGTDLTVRMLVTTTGTNYCQASVDGGAFANLSMSGLTVNTWSDVSVFTGLTDSQHTVIIRHNTGTQTNVLYQQSAMLTLTGAAPALAAYDNITNIYDLGDYPFAANAKLEGGSIPFTTSGYVYPGNIQFLWGDCTVRFKSDATAISIWSINNSAKWALIQDGVGIATATLGSGNSFNLTTLASGLSGTHEYEIVCVASPTVAGQLTQIILGGGSQKTSTYISRPALVGLGDSIVGANGTNDSTKGFVYKLARSKGYEAWNRGTSGQRVVPSGSSAVATSFRWPDAVPINVPDRLGEPPYIIIQIGHNDAVASVTRSDFQAQYLQMITGLRNATVATTILVTGILPTSAVTTTVRNNYNSDIQTAVSTLADARVIYVSTDLLWGTGGLAPTAGQITSNTTDGTHPTDAGYDALVTLLSSSITTYTPASSGGGGILGG